MTFLVQVGLCTWAKQGFWEETGRMKGNEYLKVTSDALNGSRAVPVCLLASRAESACFPSLAVFSL